MANPWEKYSGQSGVQVKPADPTIQYEGPRAKADLRGKDLDNQGQILTNQLAQMKIEEENRKRAEEAAAKAEAESAKGTAITEIMSTIKAARDAKRLSRDGWFATGFGSGKAREWGGTSAADVKGQLDTIGGNVAFDRLQRMRDASKTGGALGSVSEKELDLLRGTIASIDQTQSDEQFQAQMDRIIQVYGDTLKKLDPEMAAELGIGADVAGRNLGAPAGESLKGYVGSNEGGYYGPEGPVGSPPPSSGGSGGSSGRDSFMGEVDAFGRNAANALSLGLADRIAAAGNAIIPVDNLFGAENRSIWDGSTFGQAFDANMDLQRRTNATDERVNPIGATSGDIAGSLAGMVGANAMLRGLGAGGLVARTGGAAGDVGYLTARGAAEDGLKGAGIGAASGVAGGVLGRYVVGPAAGALAASRPGQAVINTVGRGANAVGNAGRGLIARGPNRYQPVRLPQAPTRGAQAVINRLPENAAGQLREAGDIGMPMAVADLSPELQALTGSVVRKSPDARTMAEQTLRPRFMGQADRARDQISRNFGPIDNPNEVSDQLLQTARQRAAPLYDEFRAQPARTSDELQAMLGTPAGRQALINARSIAANEGRDPNSLGFDLDDLGQVVLRQDPSPETLDLVKRGLDDVVSGAQNPLTGRIETDAGRAVEGLRRRFVGEVDRLYPQYAPARAAYAGPASERAALQRGRDMARANPRDIQRAMDGLSAAQRAQFGLGQRVAMADAVDRARLGTNPYQSVWGGTEARNRAATVFGDGPASGFQRAYDIEDTMGRTYQEALGGSQTQPRAMADEAFDSMVGNVAEAGGAVLAGGGGLGELARNLAGGLRDNWRVGASRARADEMAPILLTPRPADMARAIEQLANQSAARRLYIDNARSVGGLVGAGLGGALAPSLR